MDAVEDRVPTESVWGTRLSNFDDSDDFGDSVERCVFSWLILRDQTLTFGRLDIELCEKIFWFETAALIYAIMSVSSSLGLRNRAEFHPFTGSATFFSQSECGHFMSEVERFRLRKSRFSFCRIRLVANSSSAVDRLCLMLSIELALIVAVGSETKRTSASRRYIRDPREQGETDDISLAMLAVNIPPPIAAYIGATGCLVGDYRGKNEGFAYML